VNYSRSIDVIAKCFIDSALEIFQKGIEFIILRRNLLGSTGLLLTNDCLESAKEVFVALVLLL
jgi:hypothetical protein